MEPTLGVNDRVLVNRLAYGSDGPERGDIVAFERPESWGEGRPDRGALRTAVGWFGDIFGFGPSNADPVVKRVIAVGGDEVECCGDGGLVLVNGEPLDEPYLGSDLPFDGGVLDCASAPRSERRFPPLTVPAGHYLMLGDNRANSSDGISRCRGSEAASSDECVRLVSDADIVGRVFWVLWPFGNWGAPTSP